jgi:hypothetical protein
MIIAFGPKNGVIFGAKATSVKRIAKPIIE